MNHTHPSSAPGAQVSEPAIDSALTQAALACRLVLLALLLSAAVRVEAEPRTGTGHAAWGIEFGWGPQRHHALALHTAIEAEITGMLARVQVRQRFHNTGGSWAEAIYRYPLPPGAAVDRLEIASGDRVLVGEIHENVTAGRMYQQARRDGSVAALVEQERPNQFETRLANIEPGATIEVRIGFLVEAGYSAGSYSLELPLTFTPRWDGAGDGTAPAAPMPRIVPADAVPEHRLSLSIGLRQVLDLKRVESRYHEMDIRPVAGGYDLFLVDPDTRLDRVFRLEWEPDLGASPQASLLTHDDGTAIYALLLLAPPLRETVTPPPREVVFVIDTSGSMAGAPLEQARLALVRGLDLLGKPDWFNVVEFNSASRRLFPDSAPADLAALSGAADFIASLEADGGTNMAPALRDALGPPPRPGLLRQVVFITDGSVGNEDDLLRQIADTLGDTRLFTVSIGSAPNTGFMRKAAQLGRGSHTAIGRLEDVEPRISALWRHIRSPAVTDIRIDFGVPAEMYPEWVPDLYAGEPLWVHARLSAPAREVEVSGRFDDLPWHFSVAPAAVDGGESVAVLWARKRIEALGDSLLLGFDAASIRARTTELALQFGLLTPYTSLVAVDRTPARPGHARLREHEVPNLLPSGSTQSALGFAATATGWPVRLAAALLGLVFTAGLLCRLAPSRRA